ncbi:CDP-alcohol phosphatidyltransferase family protein [Nordella sp. HKS 07]|uniref:CDP-alcohol phosphatidyltransferase family protein n=1 Tax=Nordella sp. HKS 07 TaxID=2712222 RepID=UPI0013E0F1F1|nr:CDP-alcohol phosphatidyltransferase family protein [Nordella sp. HKS 07]QIG46536.1 CDP-alcohol phosphatidyltransferase family protein [Nordella sp. HKS 07]
MNAAPDRPASGQAASPVLCFVGSSDIRLWSLTPVERLRRQFAREGVRQEISFAQAGRHNGPVIYIRADAVLDQPLIPILVTRPNVLIIGSTGQASTALAVQAPGHHGHAIAEILLEGIEPASGLQLLARTPDQLDAKFWKALRKRETPYAFRLTADNQPDVEWRMFMGTYKGATDLVTKHVWPRPAFAVTRWLAPRGITPNMVTLVGAVMVFLAFWLFMQGQYALGLAAAWLMTFLDTVDGKLARTTLTSSKWGDVFDHGLDLIHPPFWYVAWGIGLAHSGHPLDATTLWTVIAAILGGYVLQRIMEGISIKWLGLEIHIWRKIDTVFRQITARRNPNLVILTAFTLGGRPDWGLIAVAWWTVICLVLHGLQLAQGLAARRAGPLESWMAKS